MKYCCFVCLFPLVGQQAALAAIHPWWPNGTFQSQRGLTVMTTMMKMQVLVAEEEAVLKLMEDTPRVTLGCGCLEASYCVFQKRISRINGSNYLAIAMGHSDLIGATYNRLAQFFIIIPICHQGWIAARAAYWLTKKIGNKVAKC